MTTHQTGDMIDHLENYSMEDEQPDAQSIKQMMDDLTAGKFIPEWDKQLKEIGVVIPKTTLPVG